MRQKTNAQRKAALIRAVHDLAEKLQRLPTMGETSIAAKESDRQIEKLFGSYTALKEIYQNRYPKAGYVSKREQELKDRKEEILEIVAGYVSENRSLPTWEDLKSLGLSRESMRSHGYFRHADLIDDVRKKAPAAFEDLIDNTIFNEIHTEQLEESVKNYKRFVVTTAVVGCSVHERFLESIRTYCKTNDALLLILSAADPAANTSWTLDSRLGREHVVVRDLRLNQNLFLSTIKLSAKHIDPTTGLTRIGHRNGTFVYASPKQRMRQVTQGNRRFPHAIMTTGAVTLPNYLTDRYLSERTGYIATHDHVIGGLVLELDENDGFHFRQIQAGKSGDFVDLGYRYSGKVVAQEAAAAVILGDWHSGETDPTARKTWEDLCRQVQPSDVVIHDGFNGKSINHHEAKKRVTQSMKYREGTLDLKSEVEGFATDLNDLATWVKRHVVVVESNHDQFLGRYLEEGMYVTDPMNQPFAIKILKAVYDGEYGLRSAVECSGLKTKKIKWVMADEGYQVAGIELGAHGHVGLNGRRNPGLQNLEAAYGESVTGHSHTPEILRGAWRVGTSSYLRLDYNEGPSSWLHTSCVVYKDGARQLVNSLNGRWTTMDFKALTKKLGSA